MKIKLLKECLLNDTASFKKTLSTGCWGKGSVTRAEIQKGYLKQRGILRINIHPSNAFVEPLLWQGTVLGAGIQEKPRVSAVVSVTQSLPASVCFYRVLLVSII